MVVVTDALAKPRAMVVHTSHTDIADTTMFGADGTDDLNDPKPHCTHTHTHTVKAQLSRRPLQLKRN
jgi:hypothetical protein